MRSDVAAQNTLVILLGGGQGERLYPLTRDRTKPAVPFGGPYRIIDFTLSNCMNSGLRRVYVLTQYKSISLDRHLRLTWSCYHEELGEFVVSVPPQQRMGERWYLGTADAIFQNVYTLEQERPALVVILAGDHVYKMNYLDMIRFHCESDAEITVACSNVGIEEGSRFGVMETDADRRIVGFEEKPDKPKTIPGAPDRCLGSMGIYVFNTKTLVQLVSEDAKQDTSHDFGRDILPKVFARRRCYAFPFLAGREHSSYWRDIGTLDAFWQANMDLLGADPKFDLFDPNWPIRTYHQQQPPAKVTFDEETRRPGDVTNSIVSHGCVLSGCRVRDAVLSPGVRVAPEAEVSESVLMNGVSIGRGVRVRRAIVDKNVHIPEGATLGVDREKDERNFKVTENGAVVVPKGIPSDPEFWGVGT